MISDAHEGLKQAIARVLGAAWQRYRAQLIGAILFEQNDEWQLQHRYMQLEAMAELTPPANATEPMQLPPKAA